MEKENNTNEIDITENEIPDLIFLKPFEFEPKINIRDVNSSNSDDEEEGAEYKVKRISNSEWCECSAKVVLADVLQIRCQAYNFIEKSPQRRCFPM